MDDGDGGLSFDFEGGLETFPTQPTASHPTPHNLSASNPTAQNPSAFAAPHGSGGPAAGAGGTRRSYRQTVCRHWLRSLCMKGDACGFLHQFDKARMPICRFFRLYGECREQDCIYKHTNEDIKECNMYKLGFCPNGLDCRYRHAKLPGPPPSVEEVLQKIQQLTSHGYGNSNRFFQNRNANFSQHTEKPQVQQGQNGVYQVTKSSNAESPSVQLQQQQGQQSQLPPTQVQTQNAPVSLQNQANKRATPLPQGTSRYFIVKSSNSDNLDLSVQQGVWATQRSNEAKLNEAFASVENVILIFSVNRTRHFQGCAKMTSRIGGSVGVGNWKHSHGTAHYGRNFSLQWLKLCELSFHKTQHLRNPYNDNFPVKISRDCQELERSVGEQLAFLLYLEPDSELMTVWLAAESRREEEKAKGLNSENKIENPDIVPFEDNEEEEEEEESEEEDESYGPMFGVSAQGRGRGRGIPQSPLMPLGLGAHPLPGMRGFPPGMMGGDGFSFVGATPEGFPMPDLFGMAPRAFAPNGPRFSGEFAGPGPGMMFSGRPSQPGNFPGAGFGMMGPGRPPFMGGMGGGGTTPPRAGRLAGVPPTFPPSSYQPTQNSGQGRRDQKAPGNDRGGASGGGDGEIRYHRRGKTQEHDHFVSGNGFRNDDGESEDEAPRRSRHGEGKKKRHDEDEDTNGVFDQ